jgi:pSer/pThr/pTyr-binding forkhead associated (FHA) protein
MEAIALISCAFCGRVNDDGSRFCIDCGKPLSPSAARAVPAASAPTPIVSAPAAALAPAGAGRAGAVAAAVPPTRVSTSPNAAGTAACPHCGAQADPALPFCPQCGKRTGFAAASPPPPIAACPSCGGSIRPGIDLFCARCGTAVTSDAVPIVNAQGTLVFSTIHRDHGPRLSLLGDDGEVVQTYTMSKDDLVVGRADGDVRFEEDVYLSPIHAQFTLLDGQLSVRDLGSRNGSWVFIDTPCRLADGDVMLVGSQLLRFRRLGYPGPHPPEADATRRLGSLTPTADVAALQQLRADASVRDVLHLSPGRSIVLGRELGDWVFPYDQTMSGRHAEVRSEDSEFVLHDLGSRNGVAVAVRGVRALRKGQRVLLGDQILRVESL